MLPALRNKLRLHKARASRSASEKIAILVISISRQERITLTAISPRLATKIFFIILFSIKYILINVFPSNGYTPPDEKQYFFDLGLNK